MQRRLPMPAFKLATCIALAIPLAALAAPASEPRTDDLSTVAESEFEVTMYRAASDNQREPVGTVVIRDMKEAGVRFTPDLRGLPPGEHGFHVHTLDRCQPNVDDEGNLVIGMEAGGHLDPEETGRHAGPEGDGHLGDLPVLVVDADGRATAAVEAPRLALKDITGRALIIHSGGDNYADEPKADGGGGLRIACGVIKEGPIRGPHRHAPAES